MEQSISAEEWRDLDRYLPQLPSHDPGLYRLWPGGKPTPMPQAQAGFWYATFASILAVFVAAVCALPSVPHPNHADESRPAIKPGSAPPY